MRKGRLLKIVLSLALILGLIFIIFSNSSDNTKGLRSASALMVNITFDKYV